MTIVRSDASQNLGRSFSCFTSNSVYSSSKVHIVFYDYTDNQTVSTKQTKRVSRAAGEGKRLYTGNDSQEMLQGHDYKDFLKNNIKKPDLTRLFNKFVKRILGQLRFGKNRFFKRYYFKTANLLQLTSFSQLHFLIISY